VPVLGGAIRALATPVTIQDSALQRNEADVDGGALYATSIVDIQRSTLAENIAGDNGGAVVVEGAVPVAVSNSTFSGNTATCGGAFSLLAGVAGGPAALMGAAFARACLETQR
jgi:predicted outer membrane repeat protein